MFPDLITASVAAVWKGKISKGPWLAGGCFFSFLQFSLLGTSVIILNNAPSKGQILERDYYGSQASDQVLMLKKKTKNTHHKSPQDCFSGNKLISQNKDMSLSNN